MHGLSVVGRDIFKDALGFTDRFKMQEALFLSLLFLLSSELLKGLNALELKLV